MALYVTKSPLDALVWRLQGWRPFWVWDTETAAVLKIFPGVVRASWC